MVLELRRARASDDEFIVQLAKECALSVESSEERKRPVARLWVLTESDQGQKAEKFLGFALLWLLPGEAEVVDLAIVAQRRAQGLGRILLSTALAEATKEGVREAFLEVRRGNLSAQALYKCVGFSQIGERRGYYKNGEDALLFRCCLDRAD